MAAEDVGGAVSTSRFCSIEHPSEPRTSTTTGVIGSDAAGARPSRRAVLATLLGAMPSLPSRSFAQKDAASIVATLLDGSRFSTEDVKGRVLLV